MIRKTFKSIILLMLLAFLLLGCSVGANSPSFHPEKSVIGNEINQQLLNEFQSTKSVSYAGSVIDEKGDLHFFVKARTDQEIEELKQSAIKLSSSVNQELAKSTGEVVEVFVERVDFSEADIEEEMNRILDSHLVQEHRVIQMSVDYSKNGLTMTYNQSKISEEKLKAELDEILTQKIPIELIGIDESFDVEEHY